MALQYTIVDAFTSLPFRGNPAAVILLPSTSHLSTEQMQLIAREFNLPETAYLVPTEPIGQEEEGTRRYGLRWFTPTMEFPICGHATLASAHVLFSALSQDPSAKGVSTLKFDTLSGELVARCCAAEVGTPEGRREEGEIEIVLPSGLLHPPSEEIMQSAKKAILAALPLEAREQFEFVYFGGGEGVSYGAYLVVEIGGIDLQGLDINPGPLAELADTYTTVILTHLPSLPTSEDTFISRVFAPAEGIPEDPVTGSAHCLLAPYWSQKLGIKRGREMRGRQVSERGGEIGVVWDQEAETCRLRGKARVVMRGEVVCLP